MEQVSYARGNIRLETNGTGLRILVVEDESVVAEDIAQQLLEAGAVVIGPFASIAEPIETLHSGERIDGAIVDICLRGVESFPLAVELRAHKIPFCFATGYHRDEIPAAFLNVPHLEKPFQAKSAIDIIVGCLPDTSLMPDEGCPKAGKFR